MLVAGEGPDEYLAKGPTTTRWRSLGRRAGGSGRPGPAAPREGEGARGRRTGKEKKGRKGVNWEMFYFVGP